MSINSSPWGAIQYQKTVAPGVTLVSTASHGGIHLSRERLASLPAAVRNAKRFNPPGPWYEEDVEVYIVAAAFPEVAAAFKMDRDAAIGQLETYYPHIAKALGN